MHCKQVCNPALFLQCHGGHMATKHHDRITPLSVKDHCVHRYLPFYIMLLYIPIKCDFGIFGNEWHNSRTHGLYIWAVMAPFSPALFLTCLSETNKSGRSIHQQNYKQTSAASISNGPFSNSACAYQGPVLHLCMVREIKKQHILLY